MPPFQRFIIWFMYGKQTTFFNEISLNKCFEYFQNRYITNGNINDTFLHLRFRKGDYTDKVINTLINENRTYYDSLFSILAIIYRLIYTTNTVEGYNRQIRKVIKTKGGFPNPESVRKILYLATIDIVAKWAVPVFGWKKS